MIAFYVITALEMLGFSMFMPIFAAQVRSNGGSSLFLGSIASTGAFISLIWNPIVGSLGDSKGRKSVLIQCLSISLIGNITMCLSGSSLVVIFVSRLFCAFGSPVQVTLRTIVGDVAKTSDEKSAMFNKIGIIFSLCFMSGALFSGFVSETTHGRIIIYSILTAFTFINILLVKFVLPDLNKPKTQEKDLSSDLTVLKTVKKELIDAVGNLTNIDWPKYWDLFTVKTCIDFCFGMLQSSMGLVMAGYFGLVGRHLGYVFVVISIFSVSTNVLMLRLKKSLYANDTGYTRIVHGTFILIITFLGLGLSSNLYAFIGFVGLMAVGRTLLDSTLNEVLTSRTTETDSGSVMSAFESVMSLAGLIAPLLAGLIADTFSEHAPLLFCVLPATIGTIIAYGQMQNSKSVKTE